MAVSQRAQVLITEAVENAFTDNEERKHLQKAPRRLAYNPPPSSEEEVKVLSCMPPRDRF